MKRLWLLLFCCVVVPVQADILLGDLVGGGDGSGNATAGVIGINADTGEFATAHIASYPNTLGAVAPVAGSDYVDSVFIITEANNPISTAGITFPQASAIMGPAPVF